MNDEQPSQQLGQKKAKITIDQGDRPRGWREAEELLKTLPLLALLSPEHIIQIAASYSGLTCKGTSISSDDPFVTRAERLLSRLGHACSIKPGSLAGGMSADASYARTVAQRMGGNIWNPHKNKETSLFGFGPVPQQSPPTKLRIPRLSETKLVSIEEDCIPLHEVQRELTAFRRIAGTILEGRPDKNLASNIVQSALLAAAAQFGLHVPQGEHVRLKPVYDEFMTKFTRDPTSASDTYICLIFGYAYLGGSVRLHSLFDKDSSPGPAEKPMPMCKVVHTQTDENTAPKCATQDSHAQTKSATKADCSAQTEEVESATAQTESATKADFSAQTEEVESANAQPPEEARHGSLTHSEVQDILQELLASDRTIEYRFTSPMADEDGIVLDYANATQTTEEYVKTIQLTVGSQTGCSLLPSRAGPYSIWEAICLGAELPRQAGRTLYELVTSLTASYHPELAEKLFNNVEPEYLQDFWNGSHQHSKISALGRSTPLLLRVTELLLNVHVCLMTIDHTGKIRPDSMAATTNCNAKNKRKLIHLVAGPDPRILIHTGMLKRIVKACEFREDGCHESSRVQPAAQLGEDNVQILCHFDLMVTSPLIFQKAWVLPHALQLLLRGHQSDETRHPLADLKHTHTEGLLFHSQAYASTKLTRLISAMIVLHHAEKPDNGEFEDYAPYSGCREMQALEGYLDETSYEGFQPPKYFPRPAANLPTPATDAVSHGASGGAPATVSEQARVATTVDKHTTVTEAPSTPASGGSAKDTAVTETTRTNARSEPSLPTSGGKADSKRATTQPKSAIKPQHKDKGEDSGTPIVIEHSPATTRNMMQTQSDRHQLVRAANPQDLRKNMKAFIASLSLTQISKQFSGEITSASTREQLAKRLETILNSENVPKGLKSNSVAKDNPGTWGQICKDAAVVPDQRITCAELMIKIRQSTTIRHQVIWKHVYGLFAPYILFHCGQGDHRHLDRAVLAHQLWMKWYACLKEQYDKNYP
jgi:hypothetical protein